MSKLAVGVTATLDPGHIATNYSGFSLLSWWYGQEREIWAREIIRVRNPLESPLIALFTGIFLSANSSSLTFVRFFFSFSFSLAVKRNDELEAVLLQLWPWNGMTSWRLFSRSFGRRVRRVVHPNYSEGTRKVITFFCEVPAGRGGAQKRLLRWNFSRHLMKTEDARKGNMDWTNSSSW